MRTVWLAMAGCVLSASSTLAQEAEPASLNPIAALLNEADGAFIARPLFVPSRRPPAPQPVSIEQPPMAAGPPDLRLLGVIQAQNQRIAQVLMASDQARHSLRVGDYLGGWRVDAITLRSVTLSLDGDERRFELGGN